MWGKSTLLFLFTTLPPPPHILNDNTISIKNMNNYDLKLTCLTSLLQHGCSRTKLEEGESRYQSHFPNQTRELDRYQCRVVIYQTVGLMRESASWSIAESSHPTLT